MHKLKRQHLKDTPRGLTLIYDVLAIYMRVVEASAGCLSGGGWLRELLRVVVNVARAHSSSGKIGLARLKSVKLVWLTNLDPFWISLGMAKLPRIPTWVYEPVTCTSCR